MNRQFAAQIFLSAIVIVSGVFLWSIPSADAHQFQGKPGDQCWPNCYQVQQPVDMCTESDQDAVVDSVSN